MCWTNRSLSIFSCQSPGPTRASVSFVDLTIHPACQLAAGYAGADSACLIPWWARNISNCLTVNWGPLCDITTSGILWVSNSLLKTLMTAYAVVLFMMATSSHLEYASTTMRKVWPCTGPPRSICIRAHGDFGISHSLEDPRGGWPGLLAW